MKISAWQLTNRYRQKNNLALSSIFKHCFAKGFFVVATLQNVKESKGKRDERTNSSDPYNAVLLAKHLYGPKD